MRWKKISFLLFAFIIVIMAAYIFQDKKTGRLDNNIARYELVKNWLQLPAQEKLGNPTGIGIDTNQDIFILHRANREWPWLGPMPESYIKEKTILQVEKERGKIINSWGDNLFIMPHGLTVDHENNVWVTDVGLQQVFKFNHDGKLLMKLGEAKVPGNDHTHFNQPTDIAIAKDGSFYVSDGYGNSRVIKFSADGKYLFEWGKKGSRESEFNIPHGIDLDDNGNVYVADRENDRIQVFDSTGKFLNQYADKNFGSICSVTINKNKNNIYAIDDLSFLKIKHRGSDVLIIDSTGTIQNRFGRSGFYNGSVCWYHDITLDSDENIYVGDIIGNQVQKFKKISPR